MNTFIIVLTVIGALITIVSSIVTITNTRRKYYEEFLERKKNRDEKD